MRIIHELKELRADSTAFVARKQFRASFGRAAYQWFDAQAVSRGYTHKRRDSNLAGYYWADASTGNVLFLT